jgi:CRISPR system Cascade subunit CasD
MPTLLIPLVGPLQSWGVDSRFDIRLTTREPSKSAVLGLCCAALGRDRSESIDDLAALKFGVRVDREGELMRDFHTVQDVINAAGSNGGTAVTERWYLCDAAALAALEGDQHLLESLQQALRQPRWHLSLGRKSCVPSLPMAGPIVEASLEQALTEAAPVVERHNKTVRVVLEDHNGSQSRPDQPLGAFASRRFGYRRVRTISIQPVVTGDDS